MRVAKLGIILGILAGLAGVGIGVVAMVDPGLIFSLMGGSIPGAGGDESGGQGVVAGSKGNVSGSFQATGGDLGNWSFSPDSCVSGERQGFFGVMLFKQGDESHFVKLAKDPTTGQTVLTVPVPGTDKGLVIRSCKQLDGRVQRTNVRFNRIWCVEGSLQADCPSAHFSGQATFKNCH